MIKWNQVTWYSWYGAILLFIVVLPVLSFYIGRQYEATREVLLTHPLEVSFTPALHEAQPATTTPPVLLFNLKKDLGAANKGTVGIAFTVLGIPENTAKIRISYGRNTTAPWISSTTFPYTQNVDSFLVKIDGTKQSLYYAAEALSTEDVVLKTWSSVLVRKI